MSDQPNAVRYYTVDVRENMAGWYKATLPSMPVLVGIGHSEEEAQLNLEREVFKELERRVRGFSSMPEPIAVKGIDGRAVTLSDYAVRRIQFVNLMVRNKLFLGDIANACHMLDKTVLRLLSLDDPSDVQCSAAFDTMFENLRKRSCKILLKEAEHVD